MIVLKEEGFPDHLEEMAGLRKYDSGLPVNLWLDNMETYKRTGHGKRVKFQGDYGNKMNHTNLFSMTISENPEITPKNSIPKIKLPKKDLDKIKQFVALNHGLLSKMADQEISFIQFSKKMKKVK